MDYQRNKCRTRPSQVAADLRNWLLCAGPWQHWAWGAGRGLRPASDTGCWSSSSRRRTTERRPDAPSPPPPPPSASTSSTTTTWSSWSSSSCSAMAAAAAPSLLFFLCTASAVLRIADGCSSRSTPKPRPPSPTMRPNITFQTYDCPEAYAKWYCLNGATCFSVRIGESILYNCECADGFMGQRCEFKDLDGSYLPSRSRVMIETASIAGGLTVAVLLIVVLSIAAYTYIRRCKKMQRSPAESCDSESKPINTSSNNNSDSHSSSGRPTATLTPSRKDSGRELECGRGSGYPSTGSGPPYPKTIP